MKKFIFITICIIVSFKITFSQIVKSIDLNETYSIGLYEIEKNTFSKIKGYSFNFNSIPGNPDLPVKIVNVLLPYGKEIASMTCTISSTNTISLPHILIPAQQQELISDTIPFSFPNPIIYNQNNLFPAIPYEILGTSIADGNKMIGQIAIYPFQYNPITNTVVHNESITINITFRNSDKLILNRIYTDSCTDIIKNSIQNLIINPEDYAIFYPNHEKILPPFNYPYFEYIVITTTELKASFEELVSWKRQKGTIAGVVTLDYIFANYSGDLTSGILDDPGKIRQFLTDAFLNGATTVLIGGDASVVPARIGSRGVNNPDPYYNAQTDFYFSELNGDW